MNTTAPTLEHFAPQTFRFYQHALDILREAETPFLVGGAYAFAEYTGIIRHTKDLDVFVHRRDIHRALAAFADAGYHTNLVFEHWLGKAYHDGDFIDIIFSSGNAACPIDASWFEHAPPAEVLGKLVRLVPAEEMIWQKAYIMERERFDGADVNHLIRSRGVLLDWDRLVRRFGRHYRVLLSHLILYGFVYPDDQDSIPGEVLQQLLARLNHDAPDQSAQPKEGLRDRPDLYLHFAAEAGDIADLLQGHPRVPSWQLDAIQ